MVLALLVVGGGIAYVLDLARHRVNPEMVEIEPLDSESAQWLRDVLVSLGHCLDLLLGCIQRLNRDMPNCAARVITGKKYRHAITERIEKVRVALSRRPADACTGQSSR